MAQQSRALLVFQRTRVQRAKPASGVQNCMYLQLKGLNSMEGVSNLTHGSLLPPWTEFSSFPTLLICFYQYNVM